MCAISLAHAADPPEPDWNKLDAEALGYFQSYLRFDTSNPPDNTADAIAFLKQILDQEGIETQVFAEQARQSQSRSRDCRAPPASNRCC